MNDKERRMQAELAGMQDVRKLERSWIVQEANQVLVSEGAKLVAAELVATLPIYHLPTPEVSSG